MRRVGLVIGVAVGLVCLGSCIPWTREVVVQPALEITVADPQQRPLAGARVLFVAASNPHHVFRHELELLTDAQGQVVIERQTRSETVFPLMMHGVPFYYWVWCAEKEGYQPAIRELHDPEGSRSQLLVLEPGATGKSCRRDGGRVVLGD